MTVFPDPTDSLAAVSRPDGRTEAHSVDHGRIIGLHENVMHHGAKGDGNLYFCNTTNGSAIVTATAAVFTSADVGKVITIQGAGVAGAWKESIIVSYQSTTQVTMGSVASASLTSACMQWGTDDTAAVSAALAAAVATKGPRRVFFPASAGYVYLVKNIPLLSTQQVTFQGVESGGAVLNCLGDNPIFLANKSLITGVHFQDLSFYGNILGTAGTSQIAFKTNMAEPIGGSNQFSPTFRHCYFTNLHYALYCDDVAELTGLWFDACEFASSPLHLDSKNAMNAMGFTNKCRWSGTNHNVPAIDILPSGGWGILGGSNVVANVLFDSCITESNGAQAIRARNVSNLRFDHHYLENNNTQHNADPFPIFDLSGCSIHVSGGQMQSTTAYDTLTFGNNVHPATTNDAYFDRCFVNDITPTGSVDYSQFPNLIAIFSTGNSAQFFTGRGPTSGALYDFCVDVKKLAIDGGPLIQAGTGSPEGAVLGYVGSLYLRTDSVDALWVKQTGNNTNTGWVLK